MFAPSFTHPHDLTPRMTTSLVITPLCSQQMQPSSPTSSNKRPKLSLNTAQTRTFGKGSSLRLETLSAVSPTIINTFANAYEPVRTSAPVPITGRPTRPKLSINSSVPNAIIAAPESDSLDSRTPTSSSASSGSTCNSATIPYSISQVLNSILVNSAIQPRITPRKMSNRPMFRAEKKVTFRNPLVEEISTSKYTIANSDVEISDLSDTGSSISLSSEETEAEPASSSSSDHMESEESQELVQTSEDLDVEPSELRPVVSALRTSFSDGTVRRPPRVPLRIKSRTKSPQTGDKRDSSSESDSDSCPETPVAGRRKRRREWVWTLGSSSSSTSTEDTTSASFTSSSLASFETASEGSS